MTDRWNLAAGAAYVTARLADAGLSVTVDPRQVETPGAFVQLDRVRWLGLDGSTELDVSCFLVAPDNGDHLVALSALFDLAATAVDWTADVENPFVTLELPDRSLPALHLTTRITLT